MRILPSIGLILLFSCDSRNETEKSAQQILERHVNFSDSLTQDQFTAELLHDKDGRENLRIQIRNSSDSLLFDQTWALHHWVSVANKINYILSEEERANRISVMFKQSLDAGRFGEIEDFAVTRIADPQSALLEQELSTSRWKPVYCLFYADAVLVYSVSLRRVVEINAIKKSILDKHSINYP